MIRFGSASYHTGICLQLIITQPNKYWFYQLYSIIWKTSSRNIAISLICPILLETTSTAIWTCICLTVLISKVHHILKAALIFTPFSKMFFTPSVPRNQMNLCSLFCISHNVFLSSMLSSPNQILFLSADSHGKLYFGRPYPSTFLFPVLLVSIVAQPFKEDVFAKYHTRILRIIILSKAIVTFFSVLFSDSNR